jgi:predicted PurR-regulated permease PerM
MDEGKAQNQKNDFFRQLLFLAVIVAIGLVILKQLYFFVGAFLGATTLYVVLRNIQFRLIDRYRFRPWLAAMALVAMMAFILLGVFYLVFEVIAAQIPHLDTSSILQSLQSMPDKVNGWLGITVFTDKVTSDIGDYLAQFASGILNSTYSFAVNVFMMLVIVYFMLASGRKMEKRCFDYLPFWGKSLGMIKHEVKNMIYSNAVGIPLIMLGQGFVAAILYWSLGMHNPVFWAFITALAGLIPMVGTVIVSVPLGLWFISNGEIWQGITLMACGMIVVANVDNLIRIVLMKQVANTPPLIVIFGVILGIPVFGFWGIIFGPLFISGFLLLIKIYYVEYDLLDPEEVKTKPGPRHAGERAIHRALTVVRGKAKRSAIPTPAPCSPNVSAEVCEAIQGKTEK